ncbi:hypothetical protein [Desulfatibacillum aliphaticivorans]|uniref:hypothetical protein n=1 Tax=Desulfatibacillum aliphaticivorans TaxID=218208 RepID=UPI0003FCDB08|nr:hypothetical protein [Desulfatibacillum aliphaticivorans]
MHPVEELIHKADKAIHEEDFDALADIYAEDAVLVVQQGMNAVGKEQIRRRSQAVVTPLQAASSQRLQQN